MPAFLDDEASSLDSTIRADVSIQFSVFRVKRNARMSRIGGMSLLSSSVLFRGLMPSRYFIGRKRRAITFQGGEILLWPLWKM